MTLQFNSAASNPTIGSIVTTMPQGMTLNPAVADLNGGINACSTATINALALNPNAPACYQWASVPQVDVQFNISANPVADGVHETILKIEISSKRPEGTDFIVDLSYAGLFGVRNVPEEQVHAFMFAEAPRIIFPFARRIIADAVRDGGFAPLLLEPIDFNGLFLAQREQMQAQGEGLDQPVGNA